MQPFVPRPGSRNAAGSLHPNVFAEEGAGEHLFYGSHLERGPGLEKSGVMNHGTEQSTTPEMKPSFIKVSPAA